MEKLFDFTLIQESDIDMGATCLGDTLVSPTDGGEFKGEKLSGKVLPVGMGVTYTPADGKNDVLATMMLETEDGANILMEMRAFLNVDEAVEEKLMKGEKISPDEYYFKGVIDLRTGDERYKWLERKICVCETEIVNWEKLNTSVYMV